MCRLPYTPGRTRDPHFSIGIAFICLTSLMSVTALANDEIAQSADQSGFFDVPLEQLMEVEVTVASKRSEKLSEAAAVTTVVSRDEFFEFGDRTLFQLMQRQPSVYTRHSFVFSDNLAGFRGNMSTHAEMHTLILLNGRPVRESALGYNYPLYMAFPLQALDSVELVRGPGSVLYGTNAFTGVINLRTRTAPENDEFSVSAMGGSYGYYESTLTAAGREGALDYLGALRVAGQQGYPYRMTDALGVWGSDHDHDKSTSGVVHMGYGGLTLDLFAVDMEVFSMGVQPFWSNPHDESRLRRLFSNLGYRLPLNEENTLEFNVTYNLQEDSLSSPAPQKIGTNTSDVLGEVTLFSNPIDGLDLVMGCLQEYRTNYHPDKDHFQSIPPYDYEPRSAYVQGDYQLNEMVKVTAGTQWNESGQGFSDLVSRYGLVLTPVEKWGVKLLYGEAFRAPVAMESDLYDPPILVGNSKLEPETIETYDAQLFYHGDMTYAAVAYFHSTIDKLIIYDASVSPMSYTNGNEQKFSGIELEARRYFTPEWYVLGSFMHQENETEAGLNPTVAPGNMLKLGTAYAAEWGTAAIFWTHFGEPPHIDSPLAVNPEPKALDLISANIALDVSKHLGFTNARALLTIKAENILDKKVYAPTFAYTGSPNSFPYGPGRTWYAGIQVTF